MSVAAPAIPLGYAPIDVLHAEFEACVAAFEGAGALAAALAGLRTHLLRHFGDEERWMRESGFPAFDCHKREHDKVLDVLAEVERRFSVGDEEVVWRLAAELPNWFSIHAVTMDSALVAWLHANPPASAL
ncbi:MAG: hemerythrin family protein [Pseudomonadota bacterium]